MLEVLKEIKEILSKNKELILSAENLPKGTPDTKVTINNSELLIDTLIEVFSDKKTKFFPSNIPQYIRQYLNEFKTAIDSIEKEPQQKNEHIRNALISLDKLYAHCLKYGLITFGFADKEKIHTIEDIRRSISYVKDQINQTNKESESIKENLLSLKSQSEVKINEATEKHLSNISEIVQKNEQEINNITKDYKNESQQNKQALERLLSEANATLVKINNLHNNISGIEQKINEILNGSNTTRQKIITLQEESQGLKNTIEQQLNNVQNLSHKITSNAQQTETFLADIKAKNTNAEESLAVIKQKEKDIQSFYQDIEKYKQEMIGIKKKADDDYSKTKENIDITIDTFHKNTSDIITENHDLQVQIKELLAKAVSGGLFKVFNQRQEFLSRGTRFWKWAVVASSVLVALSILVVAYICEAKPDIIFFVRLAIMIPLAFLMFFTATQYKKERMAEEEYAFKSAISLSLEPYRDLLVRMRKEDQTEADFVKKLMDEVFDNPIMRMFGIEDEEERILKIIVAYLKKLPKDKVASIVETITKNLAEQK